jgi:hypothetical protein
VLDWMEFFGFRSTRLVDQNLFHSPRSPDFTPRRFFFRLSIIDLRSLVPRPPPLPSNPPRSPSLSCSRLATFHLVFRTSAVRAFPPSKKVIHPPYRCLGHFFSSFPLPLSAVVHCLASLRATIYSTPRGGKRLSSLFPFVSAKKYGVYPATIDRLFPRDFESSILRGDTHVLCVSLPCEETPHRLSTICRPKTLPFASGLLRRLTRLSTGAFSAEFRVAL